MIQSRKPGVAFVYVQPLLAVLYVTLYQWGLSGGMCEAGSRAAGDQTLEAALLKPPENSQMPSNLTLQLTLPSLHAQYNSNE